MDRAQVAVIIEDDQDIRELLGVILNQAGYQVHASDLGEAGVELVRRHDPSLVTVDVGLPDINGFEATRRIREFSTGHIIMLTARTDAPDVLNGRVAGADEYLAKPFRPRELRAKVEALKAGNL